MELLQSGEKSLFERRALRSKGLEDLAVQIEHKIMLLHAGKGVVECLNVGYSMLGVGRCPWAL